MYVLKIRGNREWDISIEKKAKGEWKKGAHNGRTKKKQTMIEIHLCILLTIINSTPQLKYTVRLESKIQPKVIYKR